MDIEERRALIERVTRRAMIAYPDGLPGREASIGSYVSGAMSVYNAVDDAEQTYTRLSRSFLRRRDRGETGDSVDADAEIASALQKIRNGRRA